MEPPDPPRRPADAPLDALVLGAGLSGLVCARRLRAAGAAVRVLEARPRIGGRLLGARVGEAEVDLGGQWLTRGQDRAIALVEELGLATFPQRRDGAAWHVGAPGGRLARLATAARLGRAVRRLTALAARVPPGAPMATAGARALDAASLADWLDAHVGGAAARAQLALHAELTFAAAPARLSLLGYLATLDATGGFAPRGRALPGGAEHRVVGGAAAIPAALARELGDALVLGAAARELADDGDGVTVRGDGGPWRAARVVVAIPPACARRLAAPWTPAQRAYLAAAQGGGVVKCVAAYARPFWRDRGLSGERYDPAGPIRATVALADHADRGHALLGFVVGDDAAGWHARPADARRAAFLDALAEAFGPEAARPVAYAEHDWTLDPHAGACVASLPPGALAAGAAWRAPVGRIHLAGTETAVRWPGYMDGAIEAGERAAAEVLAAG